VSTPLGRVRGDCLVPLVGRTELGGAYAWTVKPTLALLFLTACAAVFPVGASSASKRSTTIRPRSITIRLVSVTIGQGVTRDRDPKQVASTGDVLWTESALRNQVRQFGRPKGATVGNDYATFTMLSAHIAQTKVVVRLPGGTLRLRGRVDERTTSGSIPVVGGTGTFLGAHGTCRVRTVNGATSTNVYQLQLP